MRYVITAVHDLDYYPDEHWDRTFMGADILQIIDQHIRAEEDEDEICTFAQWFNGLSLFIVTDVETKVTHSFDEHQWWADGLKQGTLQKGKKITVFPDVTIEQFINWLNIK